MSLEKLKDVYFLGATIRNLKGMFNKINQIIDYINGSGSSGDGSYKIYTALLTQSGTDAPTAIVLKNTLGEDIVWTYNSVGIYTGTLNNTFGLNKTITSQLISDYNYNDLGGNFYFRIKPNDINTVVIKTYDSGFVLADSSLTSFPIEIRVYN